MSFIVKLVSRLMPYLPASFISKQASKPTGWFGQKVMCSFFQKGNHDLNSFIMELIKTPLNGVVLDLGFGPGQLLRPLATQVPTGKVLGVDYSADMVSLVSHTHKDLVDSEKLELTEASISNLPYPNESIDLITTANTLYFWPSPESDVKELYRVLKTGGQIVVGFRSKDQMEVLDLDWTIFTGYSENDVIELFEKAGFKEVFFKKKLGKPFDSKCVIARK